LFALVFGTITAHSELEIRMVTLVISNHTPHIFLVIHFLVMKELDGRRAEK